jgi:FkbM family methyltransferase
VQGLGLRQIMRMPWRKPKEVSGRASLPASFSDLTSEADILACFRLLLGRDPNPEERRGHMMRVGEPLSAVLPSYLNSLEFANRALRIAPESQSMLATTLPDFSIYSALDDLSVGKYVRNDNYEREVTAVFRAYLRAGLRVVDIGANIGYFTMLSARLVGPTGHVLAVEPNPRNARSIEASRRLNKFDNVTIAQVAAGRETGLLILNTSHSNGTTSPLPDDSARIFEAETVPCIPLDKLVDELHIDFVKVDVEGAEYNALLGGETMIRRCRPFILSEFSPSMMPGISGISGEDYLRWLIGLDYELAVIRPDGSLEPTGRDRHRVMEIYESRMTDHIDIFATPVQG